MLLAVLAGPAAASAAFPHPAGRPVSEARVRVLEAQMLGPAHAAEHAAERTATRWELRRLRAMSPVERRRAARVRRRQVRAASSLPPSEVGSWDAPFTLPLIAIHSALLPTGKVLMWSYPFTETADGPRAYEARAWLWDLSKGTGQDAFTEVSPPPSAGTSHAMIFCSGGSLLPDGSLLTTGGTLYWPTAAQPKYAGTKEVWTFDPWTEGWTRQPDMRHGRWYPSQVELPDGRTLIMSGSDENGNSVRNPDLEAFTPPPAPGGIGTIQHYASGDRRTELYPHLFTMPDGRVLLAGPGPTDSALLTATGLRGDGTQGDVFSWTELPKTVTRIWGTAFQEPGGPNGSTRVTQTGGLAPDPGTGSDPPRATTETLDTTAPGEGWKPAASLNVGRTFHNTVVLPDASVVTVGGGNGTNENDGFHVSWPDNAGRQIEIRDPATGAWRLGPAQQEDRAYHSTAILLPDGRVFSGGDDRDTTSDTGEIYSPPYLFKGPRPTIDSAPAALFPGAPLHIDTGGPAVTRVVLMAPGVTTHGADMQARYVDLQVTSHDERGVDANGPPSYGVAPPGWYMIFALTSDGVPSVARWIRFGVATWSAPPAHTAALAPALPGFGASPRIWIVSRHLKLHHGSVVVRVANGNGFAVPARATLRLPTGHASAAGLKRATLVLPQGGQIRLRMAVGGKSAALIRRHRRVHGTLEISASDPKGVRRAIRRTVAIAR